MFDGDKRTTVLQLSLKELSHSLRVALFILINSYYLAELRDPRVEWVEVTLVVNPRFVHVVQDLLCNISAMSALVWLVKQEKNKGNPPDGVPTHPQRCDLGIDRRTFIGLADGHEKQRKQVEHVRHRCIQPVVVRLLFISDIVQLGDCAIPIGGNDNDIVSPARVVISPQQYLV